ncbi:MAG TPA: 50S ribosomal protein L11 [Candidatus Saccharimonadales bacterium]
MANGKKITANLKMRIPGGQASAGPPVGSTLGQYGVNMMDFINPFNEQTKELQGQTVTVHIRIYEDRSMTWRVVSQATDDLIKKAAGVEKGSGRPHDEKVAKLSKNQVRQIAEGKMKDMNTEDIEQAMRQVAGTARSMGVEVEQ